MMQATVGIRSSQSPPAHDAPPRKITRRVMLPESTASSKEAEDAADARLVRWGLSPSYHLNLSHLVGNRWTGHGEVLPRRLYRFEVVRPTGINEDRRRMDEEESEAPAALQTKARQPRTCAEDVSAIAGATVFTVIECARGRDDAEDIWAAVYPVETEARVWLMTDPGLRSPWVKGPKVEEHLLEYFSLRDIKPPYRAEGHALAEFVRHLEEGAHDLADEAVELTEEQRVVAHEMIEEVLSGARGAYEHRYARLNNTFGLMEERRNTGQGKKKFDPHDFQCMAETGIVPPEEKPVEASQKMGEAVGEKIVEGANKSSAELARAVEKLAEGQAAAQAVLVQQGAVLAQTGALLAGLIERFGLAPPADGS